MVMNPEALVAAQTEAWQWVSGRLCIRIPIPVIVLMDRATGGDG